MLSPLIFIIRILLLILINTGFCVLADNKVPIFKEEYQSSFEDIHPKSLDAVMDNFEKILKDAKRDGYFRGEQDILHNKASDIKLLVFVSTSIPIGVLKNYYREAEIYGATLVFNGLPDGSFRKLGDLITELAASTESLRLKNTKGASAVIDDESFKKFGVVSVPTFILVKEKNCHIQSTCKESLDRMSGNVGLKYALEQFSESGDLRFEAKECLR